MKIAFSPKTCWRRIRCRYVLSFIGLFALMALIFTLLTLWLARSAIEEVQVAHQQNLAKVIARDQRFVKGGRLDMSAVKRVFHRYMVLNPSLELYLLEPSGKVLLYSAHPSRIKRTWVDPAPILHALSNPQARWPLGDDPRSVSGKRPFSAAWLPSPEQQDKILYVVLSAGHADQVNRYLQESVLLKMAFWGAGIALVIGLALGVFMFQPWVRKLAQMESWVARFDVTRPDSLPDCASESQDELGHLAQALCKFMHTLQAQWHTLSSLQAERNQLIRGLAHDLKTPLTALYGYLELAEETKQPVYLQKAIEQAQKLSHLLNQLLTFARMEQPHLPLNKQPLDLAEWLQQQVAHYEILYPSCNWHVSINCHPIVQADAALLERAINNVFENILAHSQADQITCTVQCPEVQQVVVRICDNGKGVPDEALAHLTETGYRVAASRQGNHAGLGLSIVNMIMQHHDGMLRLSHHSPQGLCIELHFKEVAHE